MDVINLELPGSADRPTTWTIQAGCAPKAHAHNSNRNLSFGLRLNLHLAFSRNMKDLSQVLIFLAEWGDRSMLATITLAPGL